MIKVGYCCDIDQIDRLAALGYDYLECNFTALARQDTDAFARTLEKVRGAKISVEAANCLLPGELKLVGPAVDTDALRSYLEEGFARAARIGIRVVVFGSGGARAVPEGFPASEAWRQIASFLRLLDETAGRHGVDVAIEPLRRRECNVLNYVSEALALSSVLNLRHVFALGDTFHMEMGHEPLSALALAGDRLRHVHVSHVIDDERGRVPPMESTQPKVDALFATLRSAGYQGRVSVEAATRDLEAQGKEALCVLHAARNA